MGKSQAGKTALLEHIKSYATQGYHIDQSVLGDGTFSQTESTHSFSVQSSLPSYEVFNKSNNCTINLKNLDTEHKDDDDYQDLVFCRDTRVGLRLAPEDPAQPALDVMEFKFLDTPGLCNHEGKDSVQAMDIIDRIVTTRTFNLILIVINAHDPLAAELLLALQYYAEILGGLRSNIAFVCTHVDYTNSRTRNMGLHLALKEKVCFLSRIFQGSMSAYLAPYPSFVIDFPQRIRPVVQCMIRSTLRDILQLTVATSPSSMNVSTAQVERIKNIIHPTNFSDRQREEALGHIFGKSGLQSKVDLTQEETTNTTAPEADKFFLIGDFQSDSSTQDSISEESGPQSRVDTKKGRPINSAIPEEVNILLIGDVQSGKTSLTETMKLYAEPGSVTSQEHIVHGSDGITDEKIKVTSFRANLHDLEIRVLMNGRHRLIDLKEDARALSLDAFEDLLNLEQGSVTTCLTHLSASKEHRFSIFEAPGLLDTQDLQGKILAIHKTFVKSQTDIHHVLVTLAPNSITSATRTAISVLANRFPGSCQYISFVHTKIDYRHLHVSNDIFHISNKDKEEQLRRMTGKTPLISMIDSTQHLERPIQHATSQNAVQAILQGAVKDKPGHSVLTLVKPKYSMLVLGQTQSGKSTLLENMKKYADPDYKIDQSFLGNGYLSKTLSTIQFTFDSDLPLYEVLDTAGVALDLQNLEAECIDEDDFIDLLQSREGDYTLRPVPQDPHSPSSQIVEVTFLDTPGLNDTNHRDALFAASIIREITKAQSFNLILFTVSTKVSLSMEYGFALEYYAKVLEGLHSRISFLYTHVDFGLCSSFNQAHHDMLMKRHRAYSGIFRDLKYAPATNNDAEDTTAVEGAMEYSMFTIDMRQDKRPVIQCLIRNKIRDILKLTVTSSPVVLDTSRSNTDRIKSIVHPDKGNRAYRDRFGVKLGKQPAKEQAPDDNTASSSQPKARTEIETPVKLTMELPSKLTLEEHILLSEASSEDEDRSFDEIVARMRADFFPREP